jgi:Leucine-rich repeat (LRR) protein
LELSANTFLFSLTSLARLETPAPFKLCDLKDLDLRGDENYCLRERLALIAFYLSTDGDNWNTNGNWLDPKEHHCTWFGVTCDDTNSTVVTITLPRNGLSGPIPRDFFNLTSLQSIDFNDNDLRGKIPAEIGKLTDLKKLRLSYNSITGIPTTFENLQHLSLLHIHGN